MDDFEEAAKWRAVRDWLLFGPPETEDFTPSLGIPLWELEKAVAISLGKHPDDLSEASIREKCPEEIANQKLARTQPHLRSPWAQLHLRRSEHLRIAAYAQELPSIERGGKLWFKPDDFLTWYDTKSGWKENFVPVPMFSILEAWRVKSGDSDADAGAGKTDTGEEPPSPSGVSEGEKGEAAAWDLIKSETRKQLDEREFKTRKALKAECKKLGADWQAFERLYKEAEKLPGFIPFKRGRPSNSK